MNLAFIILKYLLIIDGFSLIFLYLFLRKELKEIFKESKKLREKEKEKKYEFFHNKERWSVED